MNYVPAKSPSGQYSSRLTKPQGRPSGQVPAGSSHAGDRHRVWRRTWRLLRGPRPALARRLAFFSYMGFGVCFCVLPFWGWGERFAAGISPRNLGSNEVTITGLGKTGVLMCVREAAARANNATLSSFLWLEGAAVPGVWNLPYCCWPSLASEGQAQPLVS